MSVDKRETDTTVQQRKRFKAGSLQDMSALKQLPLSTSESDQYSTEQTSWKGWKPLSNEPSPPMNKENADEFPPLTNTLDSWYTPQPIKNWADFLENEELQKHKNATLAKKRSFKRKLLLSDTNDKGSVKVQKPVLTDKHRLAQRQKQIDIGKNTASYGRYITETPRHCRSNEDPRTPDKFQVCSTRSWSGQVRCWRRKLHEWDLPTEQNEDIFALVKSSVQENDANSDMRSSPLSSPNEDFFADLKIDECLLKDKLCL